MPRYPDLLEVLYDLRVGDEHSLRGWIQCVSVKAGGGWITRLAKMSIDPKIIQLTTASN